MIDYRCREITEDSEIKIEDDLADFPTLVIDDTADQLEAASSDDKPADDQNKDAAAPNQIKAASEQIKAAPDQTLLDNDLTKAVKDHAKAASGLDGAHDKSATYDGSPSPSNDISEEDNNQEVTVDVDDMTEDDDVIVDDDDDILVVAGQPRPAVEVVVVSDESDGEIVVKTGVKERLPGILRTVQYSAVLYVKCTMYNGVENSLV